MPDSDSQGGLGPSPDSDPAAATKDPQAQPKPAGKKAAPRGSDPEQIAADIERTREELAETLDAIAEKVSPKRVAKRTSKKVATAVKDAAEDAAASVKETAVSAKDKVTGHAAARAATDWAPDPGPASVSGQADLPAAAGVEVPELAAADAVPVRPAYSAGLPTTYSAAGPAIKPAYVAAAGLAAALLAWLLVRKRH